MEFEQLLQGAAHAINYLLRPQQPATLGVNAALEAIGEVLNAEAAGIFEYYLDSSRGELREVKRYQWAPAHVAESTADESAPFAEKKAVKQDAEKLPHVRSFPINMGDKKWGKLSFRVPEEHGAWSDLELALVRVIADAFGAAIARDRAHQEKSAPEATTGDTQRAKPMALDAVRKFALQANALGHLSGGIGIISPGGHILYHNDLFASYCGSEREKVEDLVSLAFSFEDSSDLLGIVQNAIADAATLERTLHPRSNGHTSNTLMLRLSPVFDAEENHLCSLCWLRMDTAAKTVSSEQQNVHLRRRVRAERALVDASKLLVASDACDFEDLLSIVGETTGARYAYLVVVAPDDYVDYPTEDLLSTRSYERPVHLDIYEQYEWFSPQAEENPSFMEDPDAEPGPTFAVPILSSEDQLYGYLGIEYAPGAPQTRDEDARVLSVLGDMLCTYLQRQISEEALRHSEQRYRHFVDTISEAIWRIELNEPVDASLPLGDQVDALLCRGRIAECNAAMARLFGLSSPSSLLNQELTQIASFTGRTVFENLVDAGYRLRNHEFAVQTGHRDARHFVVNTVAVMEDGHVKRLWGSCTEVTDRVELERRMVVALEHQQQRIGRDLHDRVGQQLAGTRMLAQNLADRYFEEDEKGYEVIQKIVAYVQEASRHVSDLQRGVMPVQVDRDGLAQALRELTSNTDSLPDVQCTYIHDQKTDVADQETKLQLYRIAQEATRNAIAHGGATRVVVELTSDNTHVSLRIRDNGSGVALQEEGGDNTQALGLHSMRYRALSIGADLRIDPVLDGGTEICCTIPKRKPA